MDEDDVRLLSVCGSRLLATPTRLRREHEGVHRTTLASAGAQRHAGVEAHLVLLVAAQLQVEDDERHAVSAERHMLCVRNVDGDSADGVVGHGVELDLSGVNVDLRVEGDRDGRPAGNIDSVERRRAPLRNHFGDDL